MNNDLCTYAPVASAEDIRVNDIVFCQIPPTMRFHAHIVHGKRIDSGTRDWEFLIGNIKGHLNGTTTMKHIYGKLVDVVK